MVAAFNGYQNSGIENSTYKVTLFTSNSINPEILLIFDEILTALITFTLCRSN